MIVHLDVYVDTSAKPGDIPEPTEIKHKTFKKPKRRSVTEAILRKA